MVHNVLACFLFKINNVNINNIVHITLHTGWLSFMICASLVFFGLSSTRILKTTFEAFPILFFFLISTQIYFPRGDFYSWDVCGPELLMVILNMYAAIRDIRNVLFGVAFRLDLSFFFAKELIKTFIISLDFEMDMPIENRLNVLCF